MNYNLRLSTEVNVPTPKRNHSTLPEQFPESLQSTINTIVLSPTIPTDRPPIGPATTESITLTSKLKPSSDTNSYNIKKKKIDYRMSVTLRQQHICGKQIKDRTLTKDILDLTGLEMRLGSPEIRIIQMSLERLLKRGACQRKGLRKTNWRWRDRSV